MSTRTLSLLILICTFGLLTYTLSNDDPVAACMSGDDGPAKISACTSLLESPDIDDETRAILHLRRAQIHVRLKNNEAALPDLDRAIALDDTHWANYTQRGIVRAKQREYEAALLDFEKSVELNPISSWTLIWQGNTLADVGQYVEALDVFDKIIANDPEHLTAHRAKLQVFIKTKRINDAFEIADEILRIDPEDLWTLGRRATLHYEAEQYEAAVEDMMQSVHVDPSNWKTHVTLGRYLGKVDKNEDAIKAFDQAIELNPESVVPLISRIEIWFKAENYEQMLIDAKRALQISPYNHRAATGAFIGAAMTGQDAGMVEEYMYIVIGENPVVRKTRLTTRQNWGADHPIASYEAHVAYHMAFLHVFPPLKQVDKAVTHMERYLEIGGRDAVLTLQEFLENMGLYRGKITGSYDDKTRTAFTMCAEQITSCFYVWFQLTTL